nr:uncharacterized protein LOC111425539 [Onthophagus taurus]
MSNTFVRCLVIILCAIYFARSATIIEYDSENAHTKVTTENVTEDSYIEVGIVKQQHHLYVGRCSPKDIKYHGENIIVNNDGKSHVGADILITIDGLVYITCVKVWDQVPDGEGGYPYYTDGGVGKNFIRFNVTTGYGKGFDFYVEIFGRPLEVINRNSSKS